MDRGACRAPVDRVERVRHNSVPKQQKNNKQDKTVAYLGMCLLSSNFIYPFLSSLVAQRLKRLPPMQETRVQSLGQEDPLEEGTAPHSHILAWRIQWTEEPGRLQFMGSQGVRHNRIKLKLEIPSE